MYFAFYKTNPSPTNAVQDWVHTVTPYKENVQAQIDGETVTVEQQKFHTMDETFKNRLEKEAYELWTPILSGKRLYEFTKLSLDVKNNFLEPILIPLRNNFLHFSDRKPVNVIEGNVYIGSEKSKSIILDVDLNLQDAEYKGKKINTEFITIVKKVLDYYDVIHKLVIEELDSSLGIGENCEDRDRTYWKISFPPEKIQYNKDLIVRDFNIVDLNFL